MGAGMRVANVMGFSDTGGTFHKICCGIVPM
jgi:hypothetical protein